MVSYLVRVPFSRFDANSDLKRNVDETYVELFSKHSKHLAESIIIVSKSFGKKIY